MGNVNAKWKSPVIWTILIIALLVTVDLAFIYYEANFDKYALSSFCSINDFIDCDGVAKTTESQFLGVPLAYWGLFLYGFIMMLMCVDFLKKIPFLKFLEVFKNKFHYIASLGLISFTISMVLLCVSLFGIHKLCIMCAITYVLNLVIGVVAVHGIEGGFIGAIKQSWKDFIEALKPLPYKIAFVAVMVCACVFLGWAFKSAKFSPALKWQRSIGEFAKAKTNKYAVKGNVLGSKADDAVLLEVYSDYKCPICKASNIMVHKVARDFKNVRVEHRNLPLDIECNSHLVRPFHVNSCNLARYGIAAKNQEKFWEVENLLFMEGPETEEAILNLLKHSGIKLDMDKLVEDAHSVSTEEEIQNDMNFAYSKGIQGTPALKIGDDFEMGIKGYPELKQWLIKHGAEPKFGF